MKRKSFITIFIIVIMTILSLTTLVACNNKDKHEFSKTWSYDANCHYHVCIAEGHTDTDEQVAHMFDQGVITTPATEETEGVKTFTCSICGYVKIEKIEKLEHKHNFDNTTWIKDAINHWHACTGTNCNEKQDVSKHTWNDGEITTASTETTKGVKTYTCTVCGQIKTEEIEVLPHTHTFDTTVWEKDDNSHWHPATCSHTNEKQDEERHTYGEWTEKTPASVGVDRVEHRYCFVCNYEEIRTIENSALKTFTITWKNYDGTTLETDTEVLEGIMPEYNGTTPTKPTDETGSYVFKGWTPTVNKATKDTTYTAEFTTTYKTYTVEFKWGDGSWKSKNLHYGDKVSAPAISPTKKADNTYSYEFIGWDKEITTVTGDTTYTAQYKESFIEYTITFKDYDNTVLSTRTTYHYGDTVKVPTDPTRKADNTYTYTFKNWGKSVSTTCNGNAEYIANYTQSYIVYTVKFVNWDGIEIYTENTAYNYGDTVTVPSDPSRKADKSCSSYTFAGWDKEVEKVNGDATYIATYTGTYINYTIKFVDEDGTTVLSEKKDYHYDDKVVFPKSPTKESDENYSYPFTGWTPTVEETVKDNATYKATYGKNAIEHLYTVKFVDYDGTTILIKSDYHVGDVVTVPENPTRNADNTYTYTFDGWDKTVSTTCSGDATYKATYKGTYINYSIRFVDWDNTIILEKLDYHYGDTVTVPTTTPTKAEDETNIYKFKGWDKDVTSVGGNTTYKAKYTAIAIDYEKEYTITFLNDDGTTVVATKKYHYNDTIDASDITPTKDSSVQYDYIFQSWSPEIAVVKGDATYIAQYRSDLRKYTITFADDSNRKHVYFTKTFKYGETPSVSEEEIPTKESTVGYDYKFTGWNPFTFEPVTGDATYYAIFKANAKVFTVTFDAKDGRDIISRTYKYGEQIVFEIITREADNTYTYELRNWVDENNVSLNDQRNCYGNKNFTAVWRTDYIGYTVTFVNYDGFESPKTYHYGDTVTVPTFTKPSTKTYNYIFDGWDKEVSENCNGNATYTAKYREEYINYTIKFVNDDGTTIMEKQDYHYGDKVNGPTTVPTKASDNIYNYTFNGWDKAIVDCAGNATYTATYTEEYITYTITFDQNGGTGGTESAIANYGVDMPAATAPTKSVSEFKGYYDKDGVKYYDSQMNSVKAFDKTETLVLTAKWEVIWAYTDETKTSIYFGSYPQTKITDETLISSLNALAGEIDINDSLSKWRSYRYYQDGVAKDYMIYVDIDYDNDGSYDYRGVYMETYRTENPVQNGNGSSDVVNKNSYYNGYYKQEKYWFKYEPIKWNILTEADGYATVLADLAIDSQQFDYKSNTDYSSNYAESTIRAWLNDTFYNTAFTTMQKKLIQTVTVDNSLSSNYDGGDVTAIPCENTQDNIWLLSYQEAMKIDSLARRKQSSDYAKCQGINANVCDATCNGISSWWLRSPQNDSYAYPIGITGSKIPNSIPVCYTSIGVVPALKIKLS